MKTIYIKELRSGNFEISNKKEATHSFKTQKAFREFYKPTFYSGAGRFQKTFGALIKASYKMSQTYFTTADEALAYFKKNNIF
jgi:hypothetical protein